MSAADWVILLIVGICLAAAVIYMHRHRGSSCGGDCSCCSAGCGSRREPEKDRKTK